MWGVGVAMCGVVTGVGYWSWVLVADERPAHDKTQNKRQFEKEAWSLST